MPISHTPGLIVAPLTPFTSELKVDEVGLARQIDYVIKDCRATMVVAAGVETQEYTYLSLAERKDLIRRTIDFADKRVPVMVGISHASFRMAVELAHDAERWGASAVQLLAPLRPFAGPPTQADLLAYFQAIGRETQLPITLYLNPGPGADVTIPDTIALAKLPQVQLIKESSRDLARNRYGKLIDKGAIYKLLSNRVYVGEAVHKGTAYPGEHQPIIDRPLWDKVHGILKESPRKRASHHRARAPALLKGLIFGPGGVPMTPTHTRKRGRLYHYYVATSVLRSGVQTTCPIRRIPAIEIEAAVVSQIKLMVQTPEIVVATWRAAKPHIKGLTERQVREHLHSLEEIWSGLFPAEQTRIVQLLVARVDVTLAGADIALRTDGLVTLMQNLEPTKQEQDAA